MGTTKIRLACFECFRNDFDFIPSLEAAVGWTDIEDYQSLEESAVGDNLRQELAEKLRLVTDVIERGAR